MYIKNSPSSIGSKNLVPGNEILPDENNRWLIMASFISWTEFEEKYASIFDDKLGAPAKPFRMALGALLIQQKLNITDRETVELIRENPYLQYFIGLTKFTHKIPFHPSMMVHFRTRIGSEIVTSRGRDKGRKKTENL